MILLNSGKLSIDGVDVYPDHDPKNKSQFWYVPSHLKLAERNNRKVLSYFWYTDSLEDTDGTGFLNFEVNTAVSTETLARIKTELARRNNIPVADVRLSTVDYKTGRVSFSVLGPMRFRKDFGNGTGGEEADADAALSKDPSVVHQSAEQLVWTAGSSSLVGDNAAVCSVKLTKEGKLAAAMQQAILKKSNSIAANYYLEFLAMRPAITFKVSGTLTKTIDLFKAAIAVDNIPLEVLLLDVGIQAAWTRVMSETDLKIEVVNFGGDDKEAGLDWAKQLVLDYVLKHFFEVEIDGNPTSLDDAPDVKRAVDAAKNIEKQAEGDDDDDDDDDEDEDGAGKDKDADGTTTNETKPKDTDPKDTPPDVKTPPKMSSGVKQAVAAANIPIPRVKINISYERKEQFNTINFLYTEMKATVVPVAPQAVVLEGVLNPKDHVIEVLRSKVPFGLQFPVTVALPTEQTRTDTGLSAFTLAARYADGAADVQTPTQSITQYNGTTTGTNPLKFQFDSTGRRDIAYTADYVFDSAQDWNTTKYQYTLRGSTESGVIAAQPQTFLEFLKIDAVLPTDFEWDVDQAVVSLRSDRWPTPKTLVFQKGAPRTQQTLRFRGERASSPGPVEYTIELKKGGNTVQTYGPEPVVDSLITVRDRYSGRVPVNFEADFVEGVTKVFAELSYDDPEHKFKWKRRATILPGESIVVNVPTLRTYADEADLKLQCKYTPVGARKPAYTAAVSGGDTVVVTGEPE